MDFSFNIYSIFLIVFGIITLFLSYYIYRKERGAVRFFGLLMFSNAVWSVAYGLELASVTLHQATLFIGVEYIGISTLPLHWSLFCLKLAGKERWIKNPVVMAVLLVMSAIALFATWTNDYHHLYFDTYAMDYSGEFPLLSLGFGPLYWLFTIYFYLVLVFGCYLLVIKFRKSEQLYKKQSYSIVIAATIPLLANIIYVFDYRPFGNLDITPFAFTASILLIAIAIYRFKLFDIVPVARDRVLDLMQDGFVVLDNKHRVIDHNRSFKKYFSFGTVDIIGSTIETLIPGQAMLYQYLEERKPGKIALSVAHGESVFDLEADIAYLDDHQLASGTVVIKLQDLTLLRAESLRSKEQAEELQRLNQLKDRVFSIIAHDLRAPLVNLSEVLNMIGNGQISNEEFKLLSPTLGRDIVYTTELLENILHWSRSQLKGYGINKGFFDLKGMIVNEVNYHTSSAAVKNIEIIQDVFPGETVYADMLMIQIVVRNLLNNAIKFCNEGCTIQLTAVYAGNSKIRLCISDNGVGMSKETLSKLFTGENHSTRGTMNEKGTGLGLVVCKEFIEKNDGQLTAESEIGKGSKFCIYLPVDDKI